MDSKAVIMAHHGAVCYGKDSEERSTSPSRSSARARFYVLDQFDRKFGEKIADLSGNVFPGHKKHGKLL